jgi:nitrate ABC transporter ATP-binding subunit
LYQHYWSAWLSDECLLSAAQPQILKLALNESGVLFMYFPDLIWPIVLQGQALSAPQTEVAPEQLKMQGLSGRLEIKQLSKSFNLAGKALNVLEQIQLQIEPGEFVSIVGPSGCGKSTLLRLVLGLEQDYSGTIHLDGQLIRQPGLERGIVFQDHRLLPWMTVAQNIALALINSPLSAGEKQQLIDEHIALVNLQGFADAYPAQLSGGMAQRAAIARALVNQPQVLLLDEPLGALDALTRLYLQSELQRIWLQQRNTVIMVTHDVDEAVYLSDRVVVMSANPGRIERIVRVEQPRPRDRNHSQLQQIREDILQQLLRGGGH